jgi:hypothetical protein
VNVDCYHGNKQILRQQMDPLFYGLEVDCVPVDAPSIAEGDFGWWHGNFTSYREGFPRLAADSGLVGSSPRELGINCHPCTSWGRLTGSCRRRTRVCSPSGSRRRSSLSTRAGGRIIPGTPSIRAKVTDFLQEMADRRDSAQFTGQELK